MVKQYKHIEIVRSSTMALSSMSLQSCEAIYAVLSARYTNVGITTINTAADLKVLVDNKPDLVFLGMEFVPVDLSLGIADPDKIWISDFLDENGITYTGSDSRAHELQRNKHLAKQRVLGSGLNTSPFHVVRKSETLSAKDMTLSYPLFVKPLDRGGGFGIDSGSIVYDFNQLQERISYITRESGSDSLIEEYLTGREFSVAVLRDSLTEEHFAMPIELIAPADKDGARLLSEEVKLSNSEQALEVVDLELHSSISKVALDVFAALGARDYGRIDIRLDAEGTSHFLEANLTPSLISGYGSFPKACLINKEIGYKQMIYQIVDLAFSRKRGKIEIFTDDKVIDTVLYPAIAVIPETA